MVLMFQLETIRAGFEGYVDRNICSNKRTIRFCERQLWHATNENFKRFGSLEKFASSRVVTIPANLFDDISPAKSPFYVKLSHHLRSNFAITIMFMTTNPYKAS